MKDMETWMSAKKAVELGVADKVLYEDTDSSIPVDNGFIFEKVTVVNSLINKFPKNQKEEPNNEDDASYRDLITRLNLIK